MSKPITNLSGRRILDADVLHMTEGRKCGSVIWVCRCRKCGDEFTESGQYLLRGRHTHHCKAEYIGAVRETPQHIPAVTSNFIQFRRKNRNIAPAEMGMIEAKKYATRMAVLQLG